jgi:pimeloyl-ACP methyl ester carboxylesterase
MPITHHYLEVQNVRLHYIEAKPEGESSNLKTLVFLHGFPEYWGSWLAQIEYFRTQYRVIVPDLMGYNLSDKPTDIDLYCVPKLIALYADFVEKIAADQKVTLIAHDWGGAIAWPLAAFHPQLFSALVILNAAHPSTFTREMLHNPEQRQKSAYIQQLVADDGIEFVERNDYGFLRNMLFEGMQGHQFNSFEQAEYQRAWRQPGAVQGMLNYYRAMPSLPLAIDEQAPTGHIPDGTAMQKIPNIRINIPTLVLWGEQDEAFTQALLNGIEEYVPDCQVLRFANGSHWLHHEQAPVVNQEIANFIKAKYEV